MHTKLGAVLLSGLLAASVVDAASINLIARKANRYFQPLLEQMPGAENDTPERIALGRRLYFDPRLSINDTQSCATWQQCSRGGQSSHVCRRSR